MLLQGTTVLDAILAGEKDLRNANLRGLTWSCLVLDFANLSGADLSNANLPHANLYKANLEGAYLCNAQLYGASAACVNMRGAKLTGARLRAACLDEADFSDADLRHVNMEESNASHVKFDGAVLSEANLSGAQLLQSSFKDAALYQTNLTFAYLMGAVFTGAKCEFTLLANASLSGAIDLPKTAQAELCLVPETGSFEGWKKCCGDRIVHLRILETAKRSNGTQRKCRASEALVLEIFDKETPVNEAFSFYQEDFVYRRGEIVYCDEWNENRWSTCGGGIHFFLTRHEAESYYL